MVHALNPHDVDLGAMWEARRRAWLENAGANRYFWYSFGATALLVLSWFALAWVHNDRVRERWQLAEHAADALRYGEYCKRKAREAISRYNEHVEKCNRVRYASRCVPVPRRLNRNRMDRPKRIMDMQWRAAGFVQRRKRATGSPAHLAGIWMGSERTRNVLR